MGELAPSKGLRDRRPCSRVHVAIAFNSEAELLSDNCKKRRRNTRNAQHTVSESQKQLDGVTATWQVLSSLAVYFSNVCIRKVANLQTMHDTHYT